MHELLTTIEGNRQAYFIAFKTGKTPQKYRINFWIREALLEYCRFFAIDKKLPEVYLFTIHGYVSLSLNRMGGYILTLYNQLGREDYKKMDTKEIYEQLFESCLIASQDVKLVNGYEDFMPFKDKLYNLTTKTLEPYDARYYYTSTLSVDWVDSQECPEFRKFMDRIIPRFEDQMRIFAYSRK